MNSIPFEFPEPDELSLVDYTKEKLVFHPHHLQI